MDIKQLFESIADNCTPKEIRAIIMYAYCLAESQYGLTVDLNKRMEMVKDGFFKGFDTMTYSSERSRERKDLLQFVLPAVEDGSPVIKYAQYILGVDQFPEGVAEAFRIR